MIKLDPTCEQLNSLPRTNFAEWITASLSRSMQAMVQAADRLCHVTGVTITRIREQAGELEDGAMILSVDLPFRRACSTTGDAQVQGAAVGRISAHKALSLRRTWRRCVMRLSN